ncbi:(2Fe-2S)-binding protein [Rhodoglobus sp. NPDC076762]
MPHNRRLTDQRGEPITIEVDGRNVSCFAGETLATALLGGGIEGFADRSGQRREPLCNMGTCFDCALTVDGAPLTRTCLTPVVEGMRVETTLGEADA